MKAAQRQKSKMLRGLSGAVALVFVWLWVGSAASALQRGAGQKDDPKTLAALLAASSAKSHPEVAEETEHVNCFCMMCKGKKKASCCCAAKNKAVGKGGAGCVMTERCDGAASPDTLAAGTPLPLTVLPTLAARPLPPRSAARAILVFPSFARPALGRAPTPPHAPPRNLS